MVFVGDFDGVGRVVDGDEQRLGNPEPDLGANLAVLQRLQLGQAHADVLRFHELLSRPRYVHTCKHTPLYRVNSPVCKLSVITRNDLESAVN